jgi:putative molybdopterin biosynthesis protein
MTRDSTGNTATLATDRLLEAVRLAARQEQFLEVVSPEEAQVRFQRHLDLRPLPPERVSLMDSLGRVLSADVAAPIDTPPFDRANVDGFALRAADTVGATEAQPRRLLLNGEVLACGTAPAIPVNAGTATVIATGGVLPRGADAVAMVEWTDLFETDVGPAIELRRAVMPGQYISYAGSDIARGETVLRIGTLIGSREIGMLAACGIATVEVVRRPRVAVLSTGDELTEPGRDLRPGAVYDSNGSIIAAAVRESGGEPLLLGAFPDDEQLLGEAVRKALAESDLVVLSGGTSKGAGDLSHKIVSSLGTPGILVHGVALKPGKPLCLAAVGRKPVVVLPGFPTSAIFTFHTYVAPVLRAYAGLGPETAQAIEATVPVRLPSEIGRKEFVLVALVTGSEGPVALPIGKGSGAVTTFSEADGFIAIDALAASVDAGTRLPVTLLGRSAKITDIVVTGSHCVALDAVLTKLATQGWTPRRISVGSQAGAAAAGRGECDLAPVHLLDTATGRYNEHLLSPGLSLVRGWERMQGVVFRSGDTSFEGRQATEAVERARTEPDCVMVNRNAGAGTRVLIDRLLGGARPSGYSNQPRSHNAVAAAVSQGRADWGVAIQSVAALYGLGFLPIAPEQYDFLLVEARREHGAVQAFLAALRDPRVRARITALGMRPAG